MFKRTWWLFFIPVICVGAGLYFYHSRFSGDLSTNPDHWENFGSYISPFIEFANVVLFLILSVFVYNHTKAVNEPILTFTVVYENKTEVWKIVNRGNGPALNLLVTHKLKREQSWQTPAVKAYSLGKDDSVLLDWIMGSADVIGVYYQNIFGKEFIAVVADDIVKTNRYPKFKKFRIKANWYEAEDVGSFAEMTAIRLTEKRNRMKAKQDQETGTDSSTTTTQTTRPPDPSLPVKTAEVPLRPPEADLSKE